jgi:outer membrane protein TolC
MKRLLILFVFLSAISNAQQSATLLRLDDCYKMAEENYPMAKKRELIAKSSEFTIANIAKGYYPKFDLNAQATYQSDVTKLPVSIPGTSMPILNKDQYKAYGEINQVVYDGGNIRQQKEVTISQNKIKQQQLVVDLYSVKQRVTDLYFGILIFEEQLHQNELLKNDISIGMKTVDAQLKNGTAYRSSLDLLKAEYLKADQQAISIRSYKKSYLDMLGLFINQELNADAKLETPQAAIIPQEINRPELALFNFRNESIELNKEKIDAGNRPKLNFFVQGGIANPALNFLQKGFEWYYNGGLRLNWSLTGFYTSKKQKEIIEINKLEIEADKETFLFNTSQSIKQQNGEISKLQEYLVSDDEIVNLRTNVKKASLAQLENGVINPGDYLKNVNDENEAKQNKIIHETELLLAQYKQKILTGN